MATTRRQFIKSSLAAGSVLAMPTVASGRVLGANDEIRIGVVGLGVRGTGAHIPSFEGQEGVKVVAVCDPDRERLGTTAEKFQAKYNHPVEQFVDCRKMYEMKELDAVSVATMQYWHALNTIWACESGKHVYCEKPLSHFIWEGRQMVNAARKYDRLVQCGTQRRSQTSVAKGIEWIRAGNLGKIKHIFTFANKPRVSCGKRETPLPIPKSVEHDLWCGPAQMVPIYRDRLQYDCSFDWNTGDGESCNQGVHEVDVARWCMGETMLPRRVMSIGGRFVFNDAANVPNTQIIYYDFPTAPVLYEVHNLRMGKGNNEVPTFRGERTGIIVVCEGGSVSLFRGIAWDNEGIQVASFSGGGNHFVNFIEAVRSGRREDLNADVEQGHISSAICHAGNISYRLGEPASEQAQREAVSDIPIWSEMHNRFVQHLAAYEIDVSTATLGPWLDVDRQNECFKDNDAANKLVRGIYREPYVVPDLSG